jgi:hypothetical protein
LWVVRRGGEAQQAEPRKEGLLRAAKPHLQAMIAAALDTCCREGELLKLR